MPTALDTSVLIAAAKKSQTHHEAAVAAMAGCAADGLVLPITVMTETLAFHRRRWGTHVERDAWERIAASDMTVLAVDDRILKRARRIERDYADAGFGFVDATLLACCEEHRIVRILSLDRRLACYKPSFVSALEVLP